MKLIIDEGTQGSNIEYESLNDAIKEMHVVMDENVVEVKITKKGENTIDEKKDILKRICLPIAVIIGWEFGKWLF